MDEPSDKKPGAEAAKKNPPRPERCTSADGETTIEGRTLRYTATAATLNLKDERGEDRASIFSIAYVKNGVDDPAARPVTFCFNGGPGSSAVWLQFGAFGPRRVELPDTLPSPPAPYRVVDNALGLLDLTDLVFVDPVGTGFSRAIGETKDADFHGVTEDIASIGEFVLRWLSRNGRWASPKLVAGESYGTTRGAGLANWLADRGVHLNGLILVSLATDFQTFLFEPGNEALPCVLFLPTYAAVAAYHGKVTPTGSLDGWLEDVRRFAVEEYAPALLLGARLDDDRRDALAARLAALTGLDAVEIARRSLRIEDMWFARNVLGRTDRTVGRLDARYVGPDLDPVAQASVRDPSYDAALGAYTAVVNDHVRRTLGYGGEDDYEVLSAKIGDGWRWKVGKRVGYVNTSDDLRRALIANPHLEVLIQAGLYDLATPFFAAEYTADQLGVPRELRRNVRVERYLAGHMMYFHPPSLAKMRTDLVALFARACPATR